MKAIELEQQYNPPLGSPNPLPENATICSISVVSFVLLPSSGHLLFRQTRAILADLCRVRSLSQEAFLCPREQHQPLSSRGCTTQLAARGNARMFVGGLVQGLRSRVAGGRSPFANGSGPASPSSATAKKSMKQQTRK